MRTRSQACCALRSTPIVHALVSAGNPSPWPLRLPVGAELAIDLHFLRPSPLLQHLRSGEEPQRGGDTAEPGDCRRVGGDGDDCASRHARVGRAGAGRRPGQVGGVGGVGQGRVGGAGGVGQGGAVQGAGGSRRVSGMPHNMPVLLCAWGTALVHAPTLDVRPHPHRPPTLPPLQRAAWELWRQRAVARVPGRGAALSEAGRRLHPSGACSPRTRVGSGECERGLRQGGGARLQAEKKASTRPPSYPTHPPIHLQAYTSQLQPITSHKLWNDVRVRPWAGRRGCRLPARCLPACPPARPAPSCTCPSTAFSTMWTGL